MSRLLYSPNDTLEVHCEVSQVIEAILGDISTDLHVGQSQQAMHHTSRRFSWQAGSLLDQEVFL